MENGRLIHKFFPIGSVCIEISTKVYVCSVHFVLKPNYFGRFVSTLSDVEHEQKKVKGFEFKILSKVIEICQNSFSEK